MIAKRLATEINFVILILYYLPFRIKQKQLQQRLDKINTHFDFEACKLRELGSAHATIHEV